VDDDGTGEDVSGPCDEAEHANDPRCAPGAPADDHGAVDNSGPGSIHSGSGADNSGPGSQSSGPSGDGDDHGGDSGHSGSGGGGEGHDD
jgi:hypothetical protein